MSKEKIETNFAKLKRLKKIKNPNFQERNLINILTKKEEDKLKQPK